ncbi:hypothetical protein [Pseudomonas sp. MPB03]|uniref:hypothetical protein n=1 Tax=Pseudomonas sp. MPB03 TaxID=3388489 RepID=UPI0039849AF3
MSDNLPSITEKQAFVFEAAMQAGVAHLPCNLEAQRLPGQTEVDESQHSRPILLTGQEEREPPHRDLIGAYFRHLRRIFPTYNTDAKLATLLGLSSDRRACPARDNSGLGLGIARRMRDAQLVAALNRQEFEWLYWDQESLRYVP